MLLAIGHVIGALGTSLVLAFILMFVGAWEQTRIRLRRAQELSVALGAPIAVLDTEEYSSKVLLYYADLYSAERLRNRFSDFCGALRTAWTWLGSLAQFAVMLAVAWNIFTVSASNAVFMWCVPAVGLLFYFVAVVFALACRLLTGRYPGEAKHGRKTLATLIEQRASSRPSMTAGDVVAAR